MSMRGVHRGNGIHYTGTLMQFVEVSGITAQQLQDLLGTLDRGTPLYQCVEALRDALRKKHPQRLFYR
jgi:hypothetical protein